MSFRFSPQHSQSQEPGEQHAQKQPEQVELHYTVGQPQGGGEQQKVEQGQKELHYTVSEQHKEEKGQERELQEEEGGEDYLQQPGGGGGGEGGEDYLQQPGGGGEGEEQQEDPVHPQDQGNFSRYAISLL